MNPIPSPPPPINPPSPARSARRGLAIASFVLGMLGLLASLFVVGGLFGLLGLILGGVHLARRRQRNGFAWAGVAVSILSIVASVGLGLLYYPIIEAAVMKVRSMAGVGSDPAFAKWVGQPAPDFSVTTLDGQTIQLSELKGKRVVLDFWATWCPPCVKEIPHFIKLRNEASTDELVLVGISTEDVDTLKAFVKKQGVNYPIASKDKLPSPYKDVEGIPTTFFIDRQGVIQNVFVGYHEFATLKAHALEKDFASGTDGSTGVTNAAAPAKAAPE